MNGFTRAQVEQLLRPIHPSRVLVAQGQSHVSQHDVRAHLTRIFGFGNWATDVVELRCLRDEWVELPARGSETKGRTVPAVTYLCRLRLTIFADQLPMLGNPRLAVTAFEDVGTGTSPNLPSYGDAHDFASKNAVSYALKRCAVNLGDQFGLSLYNGGQTDALVRGTLVMPEDAEHDGSDVQDGVPQQTDLGDAA